ncbi:quinol monooxygenase YgiN [Breoghania corrubedonensis]|uniref:Quinol monooxygenase YgiN n=1 Tax=Breoghania corrubedonensis TaxID=665038 RepID=A0A2T5V5U0_9HYPH|nr:antibiotic biosynthesis monooxygenase [Breoghania corrubedonensis]PTW59119.1 quinol monooxygenase YgiN [Breoghania corrubedonensis]
MSSVTILFHVRVRRDRRDDLMSALVDVARLSREEDLCLGYDSYVTDSSETDILVVQDWETMEAYEAHNRRAYVSSLFERFEPDLLEPARRTILAPINETASL